MMKKILEFIIQYKEIIIMGLETIAALIIFLVKKKPIKIVDSARTFILNAAPEIIKYVEGCNLKGRDKLELARDILLNQLTAEGFGTYADLIQHYGSFIENVIENILSTPQKKEG